MIFSVVFFLGILAAGYVLFRDDDHDEWRGL
jgi:hypothetical protein